MSILPRHRLSSRAAALLFVAAVFAPVWLCDAQDAPTDIILENDSNFQIALTPIGASIHKLLVPLCSNRSQTVDVALGYDDVTAYGRDPHPSFGATVGRVANRLSDARFTLDGVTYNLTANNGNNTIHGGAVRWSQQTWAVVEQSATSVTFRYVSQDGESGFLGTVTANVTYSIPQTGAYLNISMTAITDKPTPLNIINHNYFNLKGSGNGDILDHVVQIPATYYTPSNGAVDQLPTGQIFSVDGTPYDLRIPTAIRQNYLDADGGPFRGFDLNYVMPGPYNTMQPVWWKSGQNPQTVTDASTAQLKLAGRVLEPSTSLTLQVYTNAPGVHFYSGNYLAASPTEYAAPGKGGIYYPQYGGFCFEAQAFPNAINTATFPSSVVRPGETFSNRVSYEFGCQ